jgi:hypothetical protein
MSDVDRAISRLFVPRGDGAFDYFPFGFKKPGYRMNAALFDEALRIERAVSRRALVAILVLGGLLYVALPELAGLDPWLALAASSPIIQLAAALPVLAAIYLFLMAERRQTLRDLLRGETTASAPLSADEIAMRRAADWRATPWFSKLAMLAVTPFVAIALAIYAYGHAGQTDGLARAEAGLAALMALGVAALYLFVVGRAIGFHRHRPTQL